MKNIVLISMLLTGACNPDKNNDTGNIDDTGSSTDTASTDTSGDNDTGDGEDTGEPEDTNVEIEAPEGFWTEGPELPACTPQEGNGTKTALSGVLLMPTGPEAGVIVVDSETGLIDCVGECETADLRVICTEGVISPGLIDGHNHMQYNAIGPWQHEDLYQNRYQWRSDGRYWDYRAAYDSIEGALGCEIGKWAELRTLVSGGTSVVGSSGGSCISGWVRNLDEPEVAHNIDNYGLYYSASTVTDRWDEDDGERYSDKIATGELGAVMNHVAEGINGSVSVEIDHMLDIGMAGPGMVFVHSTDAAVSHLAKMKAAGTSILWSPRSNLDLYAETTNADIAMRMGIPVALGPDWTWSGSANPARELKCATEYLQSRTEEYFDHLIWEMATVEAAAMVGLEGVLGILYPGAHADIAVFEYDIHPYKHIIEASSSQMKLVMVDGEALYGDTDLMNQLPNNGHCEEISACSESRTFCVKGAASDDGYSSLETLLSGELDQYSMPPELAYAKELFGVFVCGNPRESCDISISGTGDEDGDLIDDTDDNCLNSYNPKQSDHDGDGSGDACDPCPLIPNQTECTHPSNDVDEDGFDNDDDICPWNHNPDQLDQDQDGKGDACDQCPTYANPGNLGCEYTLSEIRNPADPNHPPEGSLVQVSNLVVTANRTDRGFFVQDPNATEYGGIFVFDPGAIAQPLGAIVTVSGQYTEYYGQSQLKDVSVTVTGSTDIPEPIMVSDACSISTTGADAEKWENTLVTIENVTVSNSNPDDPNNYGEFEVSSCLRIDDLLCDSCWHEMQSDGSIAPVQPAVGNAYSSITGILTYTYGHFKVVPRQPSDLVE